MRVTHTQLLKTTDGKRYLIEHYASKDGLCWRKSGQPCCRLFRLYKNGKRKEIKSYWAVGYGWAPGGGYVAKTLQIGKNSYPLKYEDGGNHGSAQK